LGGVLEAAQRGDRVELNMLLRDARKAIMTVLPALSADSYTRAYPHLLKLHMLQEVEDAFGLLSQVGQ
jgi:serine/threonine-protein kinase ATR